MLIRERRLFRKKFSIKFTL